MNEEDSIGHEVIKVNNLDVDYDSFCCWFQDQNGNWYHDSTYTGEYRNGSEITVDYRIGFDGTRII